MKLDTIKNIVEHILLKDSEARGDDNYLYAKVLEVYDQFRSTDTLSMSVREFYEHYPEHKMPSLKSVCRVRAKLQEENPSLLPDYKIQDMRSEYQSEYCEFARGR